MTTWNMGGGLTCVSLGLSTVEPSGLSAMAARAGGPSTRTTSESLSGVEQPTANMDKRAGFFKPFNRLEEAIAARVHLPGRFSPLAGRYCHSRGRGGTSALGVGFTDIESP